MISFKKLFCVKFKPSITLFLAKIYFKPRRHLWWR